MEKDARFLARIDGRVMGPWPLWELVLQPPVHPQTPVCPEFELGAWRPLSELLPRHGPADSLFKLREAAHNLFQENRELKDQLRTRESSLRQALESAGERQHLASDLEKARREVETLAREKDVPAYLIDRMRDHRDRLEQLQKELEESHQTNLDARRANMDMIRELAEKDHELNFYKSRPSSGQEPAVEKLKARLYELELQLRQSDEEIRRSRAREKALDEEAALLKKRQDEQDERESQLREELEHVRRQLASASQARNEELETARVRDMNSQHSRTLQEMRRQVEAAREETAAAEMRLTRTGDAARAAQAEAVREKGLRREAEQRAETLGARISSAEETAARQEFQTRKLVSELSAELKSLKAVMAESSSVAERERELRETAEARAAAQAERIAELEESRAREETASHQRLADLSRKLKVLQGTLVQKESVIEVMETKLETAAAKAAKRAGAAPPSPPPAPPGPDLGELRSRLDALESAQRQDAPESPAIAERLDRLQAGLDGMARAPAAQEPPPPAKSGVKEVLLYFLAGLAICLAIGFGLLWLGERMAVKDKPAPEPTRVWAPDALGPAKAAPSGSEH